MESCGAQPCQLLLILKGILVHSRACALKFGGQTWAHMLCALQAPMQVETNLRDKACNWVKRSMCSRAAPSYVGSAHKQKGVPGGTQADWVMKQSTSSND